MDKNKILSQALVTTMLASVVASGLPTNVFASNKLPDDLDKIKSDGAREAVKYMFEQGKLSGFSDNTFRPDQKVTRAEFLAMILRIVPQEVQNAQPLHLNLFGYDDSQSGDWHFPVVSKGYSIGLFSGTGVNKFNQVIAEPNEVITREEMLAMLVRAYEMVHGKENITSGEISTALAKFKDANELPSWSKGAVAKALNYKLTSGVTNDRIGAGEKGDRLQAAVFSYRQLKQSENVEEIPEEENPGEEQPGDEDQTPAEDKVVPVITLKGPENVTIYEGDVFIDSGATALDNVDGDLSAKIAISGDTVNVNKVGTYVVKYNVSDAAGNVAKEVVRTVVVKQSLAELEVGEEVIHLKNSGVTVGEVKGFLSERHAMPASSFHFVTPRALTYAIAGNPDVLVGDYEDELVVHVQHTKVEDEFTKSTIYDLIIDKTAKEPVVNTQAKTITASDLHTLTEVKAAFEVKAKAILGENNVEFFIEDEDKKEVFGDSTVLVEGENNDVQAKVVKFVFGDSLVVEHSGTDALKVVGLEFENMLDLYKYNDVTKAYDVATLNKEVKVDGTYTFEKLSPGKYIVVQQPLDLGEPGERAYDDEYAKRLRNETAHTVKYDIAGKLNDKGEYRLVNNYAAFALTNTDTSADFIKEDTKVADLNAVTELHAEMVFEYRTSRVKFKDSTLSFAQETVDHDKDSKTPDVTYETVKLNLTPDYEYFALGETVNFTLVIKDYDATTKEVRAKAEIPLKAKVVLKDAALALEISPQ